MGCTVAHGQSKLSFQLKQALDAVGDDLVHLYLQGDESCIASFVRDQKGFVQKKTQGYMKVSLPAQAVLLLDNLTCLDRIHYDFSPGVPLLSSSLSHTKVDRVHLGLDGLPDAYQGQDVIVGIIDAGIELQHPDFQNPDGSTRIIEIWDQTLYGSGNQSSYGYGQVWDSASINAGLCPHEDQPLYYGHGSNTSGIAAGNGGGNDDYVGVAPKADIVVVSSNFSSFGWTSTVADGIEYIFSIADSLNRPCVVNLSLGTYIGSHDGLDIAAQEIDEMLNEDGRLVVCAAGNSGDQDPYHLGYEVTADTQFTWVDVNGSNSFLLTSYGDVGDMENISFSIGADKVTGGYQHRGDIPFNTLSYSFYSNQEDTLWSHSGQYIARVQTWSDSANGVYRVQHYVSQIDSSQYRFRFQTTGSGGFDLWSASWLGGKDLQSEDLPTTGEFSAMTNYVLPDIKQSIVSSWACSPRVITVGNFVNRNTYIDVDSNQVNVSGVTAGEIAGNSSWGPTRTGTTKPDVCAPGDYTLTAGAMFQLNSLLNAPGQRYRVGVGGMHYRAGGTSSASPVVAGTGALLLEKCQKIAWADFKQALLASAYQDQYTDSLPNDRWGYGKLDAMATLKYTTPHSELIYYDDEYCEGDSLPIGILNPLDSILWSTGASSNQVYASSTGQYYAVIVDDRLCKGYTDTLNVFERPRPSKPSLISDIQTPLCEGEEGEIGVVESHGSYEWSNGANTQTITVTDSGAYYCYVFNSFGCEEVSDTVVISQYPAMPKPTIHFQDGDVLHGVIDSNLFAALMWYRNDELLVGDSAIDLHIDELGHYKLAYVDTNGCVHESDPLSIFFLGTESQSLATVSVYPNPFNEVILVRSKTEASFKLTDIAGRVLMDGYIRTGEETVIQTEDLSAGTYILTLKSQDHEQSISLVK